MMKYFATLPLRRSMVIDTGGLHLLALVDEENLCRGLHLIGQDRKIHALQKEIDELAAKSVLLEKKLTELEK